MKTRGVVIVAAVIVLIFVAAILYFLSFAGVFNTCKTETKTFEYAGCSVNYNEIIRTDTCKPCGGMIPCIDGFEINKQIDVLQCLCDNNNSGSARSFVSEYFPDYYRNMTIKDAAAADGGACSNIPSHVYYQ